MEIYCGDKACDVYGDKQYLPDETVTYDFARLMENATEVECPEFANSVVDRM